MTLNDVLNNVENMSDEDLYYEAKEHLQGFELAEACLSELYRRLLERDKYATN